MSPFAPEQHVGHLNTHIKRPYCSNRLRPGLSCQKNKRTVTHLSVLLIAPSARREGPRLCAGSAAASSSDWNYGAYQGSADQNTTSGAYADPRAAPAGPQRPAEEPPSSPSTSYDGGPSMQEADPLSDIARAAVNTLNGFLAFLVGRLSDAALSLLPAHVKRRAVENSVKGALALLGLALLQSVLAFVLTVGTLALTVYVAHQVFGVQLPFLPSTANSYQDGSATSSASQPDPRAYGSPGYGNYGARPYGGTYYGPYQQGYPYHQGYGGRGDPYAPRPGAAGGAWGSRPRDKRPQGPTIDVYFENQ